MRSSNKKNLVGGKAHMLQILKEKGFPVPDFYVIPIGHYDDQEMLNKIWKQMGEGKTPLAVRSSAADEDGEKLSYAGQLESVLNVKMWEEYLAAIQRVVNSWNSIRAKLYRKSNLRPESEESQMGIIIQNMVCPKIAGVMFTTDPTTGRPDHLVIDAVPGLGEALVSGEINADHFVIQKETGEVVTKNIEHGCVTERHISLLLDYAKQIENLFCGKAQDIEWAIDENDRVFILQSRPITSIARLENVLVWDNSNITESFGGVTLPLTFSVALQVYYRSYRQTAIVAGLSNSALAESELYLRTMIGLIGGRVYYNLVSWYSLLSMLPGIHSFKGIWESMIGIRESLPNFARSKFIIKIEKPTMREHLIRLKVGINLLWQWIGFNKRMDRFLARIDSLHNEMMSSKIESESISELIKKTQYIESVIARDWGEPNINDVYCFLFVGLLNARVHAWIGAESNLQNDLIAGEADIVSYRVALELSRLAEIIKQDNELTNIWKTKSSDEILSIIQKLPPESAVRSAWDHYILKYGFRCIDELKLESRDYFTNPERLVPIIHNLLTSPTASCATMQDPSERSSRAEKELVSSVSVWKRYLMKRLAHWTRQALRNRENSRFRRSMMYGLNRRIINALGVKMTAINLIKETRDIFYLTYQELYSIVEGTAVAADLKGIIQARKDNYIKYAAMEPPDRLITSGVVYSDLDRYISRNYTAEKNTELKADKNDKLQGLACSPGTIRGTVKVIKNQDDDMILNGEILVTPRTDPGWVALFPAISGLLVERGSLVSHSAIVAREMGIPTIVSIPGLLNSLQTGDEILMDGASGIVTVLNRKQQNFER